MDDGDLSVSYPHTPRATQTEYFMRASIIRTQAGEKMPEPIVYVVAKAAGCLAKNEVFGSASDRPPCLCPSLAISKNIYYF